MTVSELMSRLRTNPGRTASIVVFAVLTVIALATFHSYGISNDEEVQQTYGELLIRYYASGFTDNAAFHYRNLYLYGGLFDLVAAALGPHLPMATYEWRHLLTALVGLLGMGAVWRLTRLLSSEKWACVAVLLLAVTGAWWGALPNHTKDISFASAMIWVTYFSARVAPALPHPRLKHVIGLGFSLGCALGLRIVAVYAGLELVMMIAFAALGAREGLGKFFGHMAMSVVRLIPAGFVALAVMAVSWPWSVFAPDHILVAIDTFRRFPINMYTRIDGVVMKATSVPRWYLPVYVAIRLPELSLFGIAAAAIAGLRAAVLGRFDMLHALRLLPVILAVAVPIAHATLSDPTLYNGLRHYMFVLPPLAVLATLGLRAIYHGLRLRFGFKSAAAFAAACAAAWIYQASVMVRLHPYELVAYNVFAGGVKGAAGNYEFDYWGNSIRAAALRLNRLVADEIKSGKQDQRFGPPYKVSVCAEEIQAEEYLSSMFRVTTNWLSADFFISPIQDGCENALVGDTVISIQRMGTEIGVVKDRRALTRAQRGPN